MRKCGSLMGSLSILVAMAHSGFGQYTRASQQGTSSGIQTGSTANPYTLQLKVQEVVLDVVVTNDKGEVVTTGLSKDNFQVYEDKIPQVIRSLTPPPPPSQSSQNPAINSTAELDRVEPNAPVTLIVLDEINTRFQDEAFARYSLKKFFDKQGDKLDHPTLLGAVDMQRFTLLHDYTTSKSQLLSALDHHLVTYPWKLEGTSWKSEQFNASFAALMEIAQATAGHPGHKSLIWIGRGFPPFDPATLPQEANDGLKQVIEACTNAMRDARVTLYTLDPAGVSMEPEDADATPDGFFYDPFAGMVDFNTMARETGGHAFWGRNDVEKLIETSTEDGANFYTLSYTPATPRTDTRTFHSIRVVMKNPNLHAETRKGYYSQAPQPPSSQNTNEGGPSLQTFELAVAAQSTLIYDAVHMAIDRVPGDPDQFRVSLNSGDLAWQESSPRKLITKITVLVESFDKKGTLLNNFVKISTLQVGEGASRDTPDATTVNLFASIPTKPPAEQVRFVVLAGGTQKLGAVNFPLGNKRAALKGEN